LIKIILTWYHHLNITASGPDPLVVIDGKKQAKQNALSALNPEDVHMIQIWKGADALPNMEKQEKMV
jgi:hypothetical protein